MYGDSRYFTSIYESPVRFDFVRLGKRALNLLMTYNLCIMRVIIVVVVVVFVVVVVIILFSCGRPIYKFVEFKNVRRKLYSSGTAISRQKYHRGSGIEALRCVNKRLKEITSFFMVSKS